MTSQNHEPNSTHSEDSPTPIPLGLNQGLTQRELCNRLHLDYKVVALSAKQLGLSTHDYLQQETGWHLYRERWYPPFSAFC